MSVLMIFIWDSLKSAFSMISFDFGSLKKWPFLVEADVGKQDPSVGTSAILAK